MARASMSELIARLRLLIGDTSATPTFVDDQLQQFLDEEQQPVRYEVLTPRPTYTTGGILWNDYYSVNEHWEANETLIWTNFSTLTPITATVGDRIRGHWGFNNQLPAVLLAGWWYDVWLVAAHVLDIQITTLAMTTYDFGGAGVPTFRRGQIITNLQKQAQMYRANSAPRTLSTARADLASWVDDQRQASVGSVSAGVPFLTGD